MLEITNAAMNEPRRPAGRSTREVVSFYECRAQSAHGGVAGDPCTGDPAPYDEHVELLRSKPRQALAARHR